MSSARIRFTAAERQACEMFVDQVQLGDWCEIVYLKTELAHRMATIARLVLMLTDAPARARVRAKAKPRKHRK